MSKLIACSTCTLLCQLCFIIVVQCVVHTYCRRLRKCAYHARQTKQDGNKQRGRLEWGEKVWRFRAWISFQIWWTSQTLCVMIIHLLWFCNRHISTISKGFLILISQRKNLRSVFCHFNNMKPHCLTRGRQTQYSKARVNDEFRAATKVYFHHTSFLNMCIWWID